MSVLWFDGLLAQLADAGVYFMPAPDMDELLEAAAVNNFPVLRVNLRGCNARADLLLRIAGVLAVPPHHANDWPELAAALDALRSADSGGQVLVLEHSEDIRAAAVAEFKLAMEALQEVSARWAGEGLAFWSFVVLPEAEFDALG